MSASNSTCPKCGSSNPPGAQFCAKCGNALSAAPGGSGPSMAPGAPYGAQPYGYTASVWELEKRKQIDRTRTGLLVLLIGIIVGSLPAVGIIGVILIIIGAILVILGRKAFGPEHARNVMISILIFFVGIVIVIAAGLVFVAAIVSAYTTNRSNPAAAADSVRVAFNNLLILVIVGAAISGIAYILFTYAIQNRMGRMVLFIAYAVGVAVQIAVYALISPAVSDAVARSVVGGTFDPAPFRDLQARAQILGLLGIIPSAIYAFAYYLVWSRVSRGEIPAPTAPLGAVTPIGPPGGNP